MTDHKKRVEAAIGKWSQKQLDQNTPTKIRSNDKPEARFLLELKNYLTAKGWDMTIIEAKANYSEASGRYTSGAVAAGYPDLSGNMPDGTAVYIEVKAPGKRSTIRPAQREFLLRKIKTNCFAICCDSIEYFERVYGEWYASDSVRYQDVLEKELPPLAARYRNDERWFEGLD